MKRDWTSRTAILLVGLILVVLNLVGLNLFGRLDLTDDDVYSLSDASVDLVEGLEDPVTITAFFTEDLQAPFSANRRFVKDKLDDYRAYGGRNVQYRFVDPNESDAARLEAERAGIPPVQIQVVERDNVQLKNAYMGLSIAYGGKREAIPVVQDLSTLEYDLTSALRRLTRDALPVVGVLSGHGEPTLFQELQGLEQALSRDYQVRPVTVGDTALSFRPDVLLVIAPADSLPEAHLRALDAYLMGGGRVGMLLNRVSANLQYGQASELRTGLERLLSAYGAPLRADLVLDQQSSVVSIPRREGPFTLVQQIEYPFFPIATSFNPDHVMVSRMGEVMFYYVSSLDSAAVPEGVVREPLIYSSERSTTQEGFFMIQPMMVGEPDFSAGPQLLAAALTGTFPSAFTPGRTSTPTRLVVVGDGDFVTQNIVQHFPQNLQLALNLVDWLAQDDALLTIRTKRMTARQLAFVPEAARPVIRWANIVGPVLFVAAFGIVRWRRRKHRTITLPSRETAAHEEPVVA